MVECVKMHSTFYAQNQNINSNHILTGGERNANI